MKTLLLLIAIISLAAGRAFSQDTIITLDGDRIITPEFRLDETQYDLEYKTPKMKIKSINTDDVFSIKKYDKTERMLYKYDPAEGNGLEVEDMREMINGMSCAREHHREPISFLIGFTAGMGSVFLMPVLHGNLMYAPIIPLAAVSIGGISRINAPARTRDIYGRDMSEMFNSGYADRAKRTRMTSLIIGSLTGLAGGVLLHAAGL